MSTRPRCRARPSIEAPSAGSTISGNRVTMSIFIWVAVGAPAPGRLTQARLASGCGSHYGPTVGESPRDYSSSRPSGGRITTRPAATSHTPHAVIPSKRSGRSVRGITRTSPRRPCGRTISPMATSFSPLLNDLENGPFPQLGRVGVEDRADRPRRASLLADDLAEVGLRDPELDHRDVLTLHLVHLHALHVIDEGSRDVLHQRPHERPLPLRLLMRLP